MLKIGGAAWTRNLNNSVCKYFWGWKGNSQVQGSEASIQESHFHESNTEFMCPLE